MYAVFVVNKTIISAFDHLFSDILSVLYGKKRKMWRTCLTCKPLPSADEWAREQKCWLQFSGKQFKFALLLLFDTLDIYGSLVRLLR